MYCCTVIMSYNFRQNSTWWTWKVPVTFSVTAQSFFARMSSSKEAATIGVLLKKGVFKDLVNFTGKHLCWSLFLIKLQAWTPATLLKRDSNTGVFLWSLLHFQEQLFWRTQLLTAASGNGLAHNLDGNIRWNKMQNTVYR